MRGPEGAGKERLVDSGQRRPGKSGLWTAAGGGGERAACGQRPEAAGKERLVDSGRRRPESAGKR